MHIDLKKATRNITIMIKSGIITNNSIFINRKKEIAASLTNWDQAIKSAEQSCVTLKQLRIEIKKIKTKKLLLVKQLKIEIKKHQQ